LVVVCSTGGRWKCSLEVCWAGRQAGRAVVGGRCGSSVAWEQADFSVQVVHCSLARSPKEAWKGGGGTHPPPTHPRSHRQVAQRTSIDICLTHKHPRTKAQVQAQIQVQVQAQAQEASSPMHSPPSERSFTIYRSARTLLRQEALSLRTKLAQLLASLQHQQPPPSPEASTDREHLESWAPPVPPKDLPRKKRSQKKLATSPTTTVPPPPYRLSWLSLYSNTSSVISKHEPPLRR
jgi:hypothetical protein